MHSAPPISKDVIDLGPELFASADLRVISYKGNNYYKTCDEKVYDLPAGGATHCVLRMFHHYGHQDFEGRVLEFDTWVTSYDDQVRSRFRSVLKSSGLDDTQVYNAMNALQMAGLHLSIKEES